MAGRGTERTRHTSRVCPRCSGSRPACVLVPLGASAPAGTLPQHLRKAVSSLCRCRLQRLPSEQPALLTRVKTAPPLCFPPRHPFLICFGALVSTCDQSPAMLVLVFAAGLPNDTVLSFCALAPDRAQNSRLTLSRCSMKVCWLTPKRVCAPPALCCPGSIYAHLRARLAVVGEGLGLGQDLCSCQWPLQAAPRV